MKTGSRLGLLGLSLCLTVSVFFLLDRQIFRPSFQFPAPVQTRFGDEQPQGWQEKVAIPIGGDFEWAEPPLHPLEPVKGSDGSSAPPEDWTVFMEDSEKQQKLDGQHKPHFEHQITPISDLAGRPVQKLEEQQATQGSEAQHSGSLPDKVVVMGRLHTDDVAWVQEELSDWQHAIYLVDAANATSPISPTTLTTPLNKGRESYPYLTYIIDHYASLPSLLAFIHPHRDGYPIAWHTDAPQHSNVYALNHLNLEYIKTVGYANLRCGLEPGCPAEVRPFTIGSKKEPEAHMAEAWPQLFPDRADAVPEVIASACCAQFAVSAEQVRKRPLEDYVRIRDWVVNTPLNDFTSGRVLEYSWHIIFGKDPVHCPSSRDCYCNVYGRRCRRPGIKPFPGPKNEGPRGPSLSPSPSTDQLDDAAMAAKLDFLRNGNEEGPVPPFGGPS